MCLLCRSPASDNLRAIFLMPLPPTCRLWNPIGLITSISSLREFCCYVHHNLPLGVTNEEVLSTPMTPPIYDHVLIIHAMYTIEIRDSPWEYHSTTLQIKAIQASYYKPRAMRARIQQLEIHKVRGSNSI